MAQHYPRVIIAEHYETHTTSVPRIHHKGHINVLRCTGSVEQVGQTTGYVSFGPKKEDIDRALATLDGQPPKKKKK